MTQGRRRVTGLVVGVAGALMLAVLGTATKAAAHGDDAGVIHACVQQGSQQVRIVGPNEACRGPEAAVHWSIVGPPGPKGDKGDQGLQGIQGPKGDTGATGSQGPAGVLGSYDELEGLACTTAIGTQGTVHLVGLLKSPQCAEGVSANGRYVDFGLVVFDTQTNLMWEKKDGAGGGPNFANLHDVDNKYTWCQATGNSAEICAGNATSWIGQVNAEGGTGFAGFSNWRVPTLAELQGILDTSVTTCGSGTPCIDPIFGPTAASFYWSSTEGGATFAHIVDFFFGSRSSSSRSSSPTCGRCGAARDWSFDHLVNLIL